MYWTELVAKWRFCAFHSAAGAVDHLRRDRYPVEFCPQFSGFLAQSVVVCKRRDSGIAGFAVQSAAADQLVCVFHNFCHSFRFAQGTNKWDIDVCLTHPKYVKAIKGKKTDKRILNELPTSTNLILSDVPLFLRKIFVSLGNFPDTVSSWSA